MRTGATEQGRGEREQIRAKAQPALLVCLLCGGLAQHSRRPVFWYGLAWPCRMQEGSRHHSTGARTRQQGCGTCWYAHATMRRQRGAAFSDLSLSFPSGLTSQTYIYLAVLSWFLLPVLENPDSGRWYIILSLNGDGSRSIDRLLPDIEDICLATRQYISMANQQGYLVCYGYGLALLLLEREDGG
jgi:hypothetical protein